MLYDVTNRQSFDNIKLWNRNIERDGRDVIRMIVGTKSDLDEQRVVSTNEGQVFSFIHFGFPPFFTHPFLFFLFFSFLFFPFLSDQKRRVWQMKFHKNAT